MLIALFGEQILAIVLAFWGAIAGWKKHSALNLFLGLWAIVSTLLVLLNPVRQVVDWAWTLLPLWILTAFGLENLVQRFNVENGLLKLFQTVATFALIIFSYLNFLSGVVGAVNSSALQENYILSVILPLALLVVVTILVGWGWSSEAAWQGLLLGIGLLLVMITFGSAWKSAGLGPRPEAELWRSDAYPVGRDLTLKSVKNISLWNTGQETGIDLVLLNQNQASLQWELHDFENLKETNVLGDSDTPSLIISSAENELSLTKSYRGQEIVWSSAPDFANKSAENCVKWFAFRQVPLKNTSILLWAKNDLFKGS